VEGAQNDTENAFSQMKSAVLSPGYSEGFFHLQEESNSTTHLGKAYETLLHYNECQKRSCSHAQRE
jgi:hypothetical protein